MKRRLFWLLSSVFASKRCSDFFSSLFLIDNLLINKCENKKLSGQKTLDYLFLKTPGLLNSGQNGEFNLFN